MLSRLRRAAFSGGICHSRLRVLTVACSESRTASGMARCIDEITAEQRASMRIGLVGYGTGGKNFHAPYIEAAADCELVGIVARAPATVARAQADWPRRRSSTRSAR